MKLKYRLICYVILLALMGFSWPFSFLFTSPNPLPINLTSNFSSTSGGKEWIDKEVNIIRAQAGNIDPNVLRLSLNAYLKLRKKGEDSKQLLTVIDYSKPSTQKRFWVFDLKNGRTLFNTYVAHGRNSGGTMATSFSNAEGSLKSSFGVFVTEDTYIGHVGYALHMKGLEPGVNSNAYDRSVVIHGAWYVNADVVRQYGTLGRSWGCPAVPQNLARPIIDTIKNDTVVFAYYPDHHWLKSSPYLA